MKRFSRRMLDFYFPQNEQQALVSRIGVGFAGDLPVQDMVECVCLAENKGFESVWMAEDYFLRDAISPTVAFASYTKKIKLAIGVINPYTRNLPVIAMTAATIDEFSNKRFILGIGAGVRRDLEQLMGEKFGKPLPAVRESIGVIRKLLAGKTVTYHGEITGLHNVRLYFKPIREHIPIYVAAVSPHMLQLAGEIADGVLLTAGCSPEYVKYAVKNVDIGARRVGRNLSEVDVACYVMCSVSEKIEDARAAARFLLGFCVAPPYGDLIFKETGLDRKHLENIRSFLYKGDMESMSMCVNDQIIEALTASGTPRTCKDKLNKYVEAGVKLPIIVPVSPNAKKTVEVLEME